MFTFKQYIEEALNKPYGVSDPIVKKGSKTSKHHYYFQDHDGRKYKTEFFHSNSEPDKAELAFADEEGNMHITGKSGRHSIRIFSTLKHIIDKHAAAHKNIKTITFSSEREPIHYRSDIVKPKKSKMSFFGKKRNTVELSRSGKDREKYGSRAALYGRFAASAGGKTHNDKDSMYIHHEIPVNREK